MYEATKERTRDRRTDFKAPLMAMLGDKIEFSNRTSGPHKNRAFIRGLGYANHLGDESVNGDNVVSINTLLEKKADKGRDGQG